MALSPKQREFIRDETPTKIAHGAIRSSKTLAQIIDWLHWVPTAPPGPLAVVGKTRDTIGRNVLEVVEELHPDAIRWRAGAPTCTIMGRKHHVLGANDASAESKVRGLTLAGVLVDEVTLLTEDFFTTLLGRLSVDGARLLGTTNPDSPNHWFKRKYLDRATELGWSVHKFSMGDNPGLTPAYVERVSREYTGLYYRRFILGDWVAAEGSIYTTWDPDRMVVPWDQMPPLARYVGVGIDYGTTNPTSAVLLGVDHTGVHWLVDEYRWDPAETNQRLTDAEQSARVRDWLHTKHTPHIDPVLTEVTVDPAAASFRIQLAQDGVHTSPANNDVKLGIQTLSKLITTDRFRVTTRCTGFIREAPGYAWDPKATERGEDAPVKDNDHSMDATRYATMIDHNPRATTGVVGLD